MRLRIWKLLWPLRAWRRKGLEEGDYFPGFTLSDAAGRRFSLSENPEGKMTVLWLTNLCEDCRSKVPLLEELRREAGDRLDKGLRIVFRHHLSALEPEAFKAIWATMNEE